MSEVLWASPLAWLPYKKTALYGGWITSITSLMLSAVNTMDEDFCHKRIPEEAKRSCHSEKESSERAAAKVRIAEGKEQKTSRALFAAVQETARRSLSNSLDPGT